MDTAVASITLPDSSIRTRTSTTLSLVMRDSMSAGTFGRSARIASADEEPLPASWCESGRRCSTDWTEASALPTASIGIRLVRRKIVAKLKHGRYGEGWFKVRNPTYSQREGRRELFEKKVRG
jgi:hypothetical protein